MLLLLLLMLWIFQNELRKQKQVVTEAEREHAMSGNFQQLLNEQDRLDTERDNEVRGTSLW